MDKYNGLLSKVSRQYHILRGTQETEDKWKTRLVYSICGMMAYASLWDDAEEPISIVHLKGRVHSVLGSYKSLYNYRSLACACLSTYGTLPPIEYFEDGALVHVRMNYLLPPRELEFLKLYSWPEICTSLPCNFRRKLSIEVFTAIKNVLSDEGYEFKGGAI